MIVTSYIPSLNKCRVSFPYSLATRLGIQLIILLDFDMSNVIVAHVDKLCTKLDGRRWKEILVHVKDDARIADAIQTTITTFHSLAQAVGKVAARKYIREANYKPEVNEDNERLCVFMADSVRCCVYNRGPLCVSHYPDVAMYTNFFKSKSLKEEFTAFHNSPHKVQLDAEQAIMRTMMAQLIKRCKEGDVTFEMIGAITTMCEKIAALSVKMASINQVTPDQIETLLNRVTDILAQFVPPEKLEEAAAELAKLTISSVASNIPYEPGAVIEYEGKAEVIEADLGSIPRQRALEEVATRFAIDEAMIPE